MTIRFVLMVNKQGQTRLAQYYEVRSLASPGSCLALRRDARARLLRASSLPPPQHVPVYERCVLEGEIVRKCLARSDKQCSIVEHRNYKASPRLRAPPSARFSASPLRWCTGGTHRCTCWQEWTVRPPRASSSCGFRSSVPLARGLTPGLRAASSADENALAALELVHGFVEALDRYFGSVCELDIMFHLDKAHFILDEMVMNGCIVETNRTKVLTPVQLLDQGVGAPSPSR